MLIYKSTQRGFYFDICVDFDDLLLIFKVIYFWQEMRFGILGNKKPRLSGVCLSCVDYTREEIHQTRPMTTMSSLASCSFVISSSLYAWL